jgi:copper homeostasis protein
MKLLEVIVTSLDEAREAQAGGADRIELVRDLELEGLTPELKLVEDVVATVSIPVRVMLRDTPSFEVKDRQELELLTEQARRLTELPIDGLVLGFLRDGDLDSSSMRHLLTVTRLKPVTFHRALEAMADAPGAIRDLKSYSQIDRVLTNGGSGCWKERREILEHLQRVGNPEITVLTGGGLDAEAIEILADSPLLNEFHVGRAVRDSSAKMQRGQVAKLRRLLNNQT